MNEYTVSYDDVVIVNNLNSAGARIRDTGINFAVTCTQEVYETCYRRYVTSTMSPTQSFSPQSYFGSTPMTPFPVDPIEDLVMSSSSGKKSNAGHVCIAPQCNSADIPFYTDILKYYMKSLKGIKIVECPNIMCRIEQYKVAIGENKALDTTPPPRRRGQRQS